MGTRPGLESRATSVDVCPEAFPLQNGIGSTAIDPRQLARDNIPLAFCQPDHYFGAMVIATVRRISAVILALVLVLGPASGGLYASMAGAKAAVVSVSGNSHSPGNCDHCGGKGGLPAGPCSLGAFCSSPAIAPVDQFVPEQPSAALAVFPKPNHLTGRAQAPDPYPPRCTILS